MFRNPYLLALKRHRGAVDHLRMELTHRRVGVFALVAAVLAVPLAILLEAAGEDVALAVAVAAVATLVLSYVRMGVIAWRAMLIGGLIRKRRARGAQPS